MKRRNIGSIVIGVIFVVCIIMALHQYREDQKTEEGKNENPLGITITKIEDEYDLTKDYYEDYDDTGLETYIITGVFTDEETYIREIREAGVCEYIYKNEEGNGEIKVTEKQREEWLEKAKKNIENVLESLKDEEMCSFEFNEDYTILESNLDKQYSVQCYTEDLFDLIYNAEIMQIFSGVEDWSVNVIIKNMNTGYELVNVQYPQEDMKLTPEMWDE